MNHILIRRRKRRSRHNKIVQTVTYDKKQTMNIIKHITLTQTQPSQQCESQSSKAYPSRTIVHAKLEMTEPDDHDEQEADAVANTIVNGGKIARKISGGGGSSGIAVSTQMESQLSQLQGGGRQMPEGLRNMMESGFGQDFSQVRLHTDSEAASMSSSIHAKAFTLGKDIYFNRGQFSPETSEGQRLVAHELTHVVQGSGRISRENTNQVLDLKKDELRIFQLIDSLSNLKGLDKSTLPYGVTIKNPENHDESELFILRWLRYKNFNYDQAIAILANWDHESYLDPTRVEALNDRNDFGVWTPKKDRQSRRRLKELYPDDKNLKQPDAFAGGGVGMFTGNRAACMGDFANEIDKIFEENNISLEIHKADTVSQVNVSPKYSLTIQLAWALSENRNDIFKMSDEQWNKKQWTESEWKKLIKNNKQQRQSWTNELSELKEAQKNGPLSKEDERRMKKLERDLMKMPLEDVKKMKEKGNDKYTEVFMMAFEGVNNNLEDRVKRAIALRKKYKKDDYNNISFEDKKSENTSEKIEAPQRIDPSVNYSSPSEYQMICRALEEDEKDEDMERKKSFSEQITHFANFRGKENEQIAKSYATNEKKDERGEEHIWYSPFYHYEGVVKDEGIPINDIKHFKATTKYFGDKGTMCNIFVGDVLFMAIREMLGEESGNKDEEAYDIMVKMGLFQTGREDHKHDYKYQGANGMWNAMKSEQYESIYRPIDNWEDIQPGDIIIWTKKNGETRGHHIEIIMERKDDGQSLICQGAHETGAYEKTREISVDGHKFNCTNKDPKGPVQFYRIQFDNVITSPNMAIKGLLTKLVSLFVKTGSHNP